MTIKNNPAKTFLGIRLEILICFFLVVTTISVYWQVRTFDFILFDDTLYVSENHYVKKGLTFKSFHWAFSFENKNKTYWHPLTWLSHMADCHVYGLEPGSHHTTNLIFHILSSLLLFSTLKRMTGALWQSAFVTSLFALHPLNVNSVAWIAERKNVLSTFFWMLTMWLYAWYCVKPKLYRYLPILLSFSFGLMSKPMLVTLPFVLILLDYWPLERFKTKWNDNAYKNVTITNLISPKPAIRHKLASFPFVLLIEKIPFFILSGVTVYLSWSALHNMDEMISFPAIPITLRIENALVSYIIYISKMLWPQSLAIFYPFPDKIPLWQAASALCMLLIITILAIKKFKQHPYFIVGWFWYIGTLVPVSGLVQAGLWPALASRFVYVPLIGLFIILVWGFPELYFKWLRRKTELIATVAVILITLIFITYHHVQYWKNDITLFQHALDVTDENGVAHNNLGLALMRKGKISQAIFHFQRAIDIKERNYGSHNNLGLALVQKGKLSEAIFHYSKSLDINPSYMKAHNNWGIALAKQGKPEKAIARFRLALQIDPFFKDAHNNLGFALVGQGKSDKAIEHYHLALSTDPSFTRARNNLAQALLLQGRIEEAVYHYFEVLRMDPHNTIARDNLRILADGHSK